MAKSSRRFPRGFFVIWSTVAVDLIGFGIVLPILPQYAERFGAGAATIGLLSASFSFMQLIFAPFWGRVSDRIGRKPVILLSLFGTAIGSFLTGRADALWLLFAGRILDGISGASVSVSQAAVADLAAPKDRARYMGLLGAAFGVGFVAGPMIGALGALGGPHVPFYIAAALAFVNGVVAIFRLPETAHGVAGHPKARPEVVAERLREQQASEDGDSMQKMPSLDGPGLAEPAHFDRRVVNAPAPDIRARIFRFIFVSFVAVVAFSGFESTFSLLTKQRFELELAATALLFGGIGILLVGVQGGLVGPVTKRLGEQRTIRFGLAANCVGLLLLSVSFGWVGLILSLVILTIGQGLLTPTLSSAIAGLAGNSTGSWLGWQQAAGGLGRVVGPLAAGALFQWAGASWPYVVGSVLALAALALLPRAASSPESEGSTSL